MQQDQKYKFQFNHPLRYSQYISKDCLLQHLNDLSIDQSDQKYQKTKPIKLNILKFSVPNKNNQENQFKYQQIMRQLSPNRQLYSRENISMMNRKYRQIRMNNYATGNPEDQNDSGMRFQNNISYNKDIYRVKTAISSARPMTNIRYQDAKVIPEIRGISSSLQVQNKIQRNFRTSRYKSLKKNKNRNQQQLKRQDKNMIVQPAISYGQHLSKSQLPSNEKIIPNNFKAKIKKKCVEDNLNIMANMIKKKVKVLSKDEMYNYISYLMNRHLQKG